MLRPIPKKIMTHSAVLKTVKSTDRWASPTYEEVKLTRVHIQPVHDIRKSADNKEIHLNGVLFYDPHISSPSVNWNEVFNSSAIADGQMKVVYNGRTYTVWSIDLLPDDEGNLHHVEVAMY